MSSIETLLGLEEVGGQKGQIQTLRAASFISHLPRAVSLGR